MAYTTVDKVINTLTHRDIDNESVVTLKDVQGIISNIDKIVLGRLKIAGHDVESEIESATYTDTLETIETLMAAGWVERNFTADDGGEDSTPGGEITNNYYREGNNLLIMLAQNNEFDTIPDIDTVVDNITGSEGELDPHFSKNVRQW